MLLGRAVGLGRCLSVASRSAGRPASPSGAGVLVDRARDGKPHSGRRRYGYPTDGLTIIPAEAEIVRWVFESFLDGMTPYLIAENLNMRAVPTADGKLWTINGVIRLLDFHHVAGYGCSGAR